MQKYHKILTVWERDPDKNFKTLIEGRWACPEFDYLKDLEWVFTEKIDGMNIRVNWDRHRVMFGGRDDNSQAPFPLVTKLQEMFPERAFRELYPNLSMTLYGEGYGAGIQKGGGKYIPDGVSFIAFDVVISGNYQPRTSLEDIAGKLGIDIVPIVGTGTLMDAINMCREDELESVLGTAPAEGLVMRPAVELQTRDGYRIIAKIKRKDFR